tara:strand:+ start:8254 stop:8976 length:723 start_codon:yes stop_codon:yes gene_type:complete
MKFDAWVLSDKGRRRDSNQDSVLVNPEVGLFIVADGMGGHSGGEVASSLAVSAAEEVFKDPESKNRAPREMIARAYEQASHQIYDKAAKENPELAGMGTTMVMCYIRKNHIYIGNVGDSRCYLFKKPHLWQVTEDHSLINEQIRAGVLSEQQASQLIGRNVITRSVGYEREVDPDIFEREIFSGETYLLCSDGLSSLVGDARISEIMEQNAPVDALKACVEEALKNGGDDNVSVLILHFE